MFSKILSGKYSEERLHLLTVAVSCVVLATLNAAVYFFVPLSQGITLQPLTGADAEITATMKMLYLGASGAFVTVVLSLVRNPARWIVSIFFFIAIVILGNFTISKLNIVLDESIPKLVHGKLKEISKEKRYGKTLWAVINDENDQPILITTRFDVSRKLVQVDGTSVTFFMCEGYYKYPYICTNTPK